MGASVAWHLASRGVPRIVLLDRAGGPGRGSTGAATGGFRAQFATDINVRLSLLARAKLLRFRDETGVDPGYLPTGYLWLAECDEHLEALRNARAVQHAAGLVEAVEVTPRDVARLQPAVALAGIVGGAYCPTDGYIRPLAILEGYLRAAGRLGARVGWGESATGFDLDRAGRITAVRTAAGSIACEVVVNAAGAFAGRVARLAGADLPVSPQKRQVAVTAPTDVIPPDAPMTIFCGDGFHFRERDGRVLVLRPAPARGGDAFDVGVEPDWLREMEVEKGVRVPPLRDVPLDSAKAWAGLYEMSPDRHAILGVSPERPNLYFINGSSGHGVMHAPALGQLLAEIITDGRASSLDAAPLRPDRFRAGWTPPAPEVL